MTNSTLACKEHLDKMEAEDIEVANDYAKQLASILSMVSIHLAKLYVMLELLGEVLILCHVILPCHVIPLLSLGII